MKKIIYSTVTALILSVILALIFPTWFLRGDARWTHLNETARVDIYFEGNPKNGRVEVGGRDLDLRITRPKFLSVNRSQGVVVEIPVSYRTKSYKIKFTPQADEWGNNTKVIVRFMSQYFQYDGKKRPAWVVFRNITLNGQPVAGERVVWHDQHFVQKYPLHSSGISTLTFDVYKPLAAPDISFVNVAALFFVCLLFSLFFAPLKQVVDRCLTFIDRKFVVSALKDSYLHIDLVYRRSFWIIFGILCFAFGLHAIWFMWGNHDWSFLAGKHHLLDMAHTGRYMKYLIKVLLSSGVYLPMIYDIIAILALSFNAILLCKLWRLERRVIYYVICGLVLTVQPFTLSMLWYIDVIPEVFIGVTCVLSALLLSENVAVPGGARIKKVVHSVIAVVLINFSLAIYPVLINTIAVAFVGRLLVQAFDWNGSWRNLHPCMRSSTISVANIILGIASYKLIITYAFPIQSSYNTDMLPLERIPERLGILLKQSFHQLYEYNYPFLPQWFSWVFLSFTIMLVLYVCFTGNIKQKIVRLLLLFASLFTTQTAMIIAKTHLIDGRVELFGLVFYEVLVMVLVLSRLRKLKNVSVVAGGCVIFASVLHDLDCLRVWKLGFDAEKMLWNRMISRLEIQKDFVPGRKYSVIQIGAPITLRLRYYTGERKKFVNSDHLDILYPPYDAGFSLFYALEFYYPVQFRSTVMFPCYKKEELGYLAQMRRLYQAGVLQKAEVWPKQNGLMVWKDLILFVTDGKELDNFRKRFEQELGKK